MIAPPLEFPDDQYPQMTVQEFDQWVLMPENVEQDYEFIAGKVHDVVAHPKSSKLAALMTTYMGMYLLGNDIGHLTSSDGGYKVSGERFMADVGFISYQRQPEVLSDGGYNPEPPDLAVEVISPTDSPQDIASKIANYLAAGTTVWLLDGDGRQVSVFAPGQPVRVLKVGDMLDGGTILPGFTVAIADIFKVKA